MADLSCPGPRLIKQVARSGNAALALLMRPALDHLPFVRDHAGVERRVVGRVHLRRAQVGLVRGPGLGALGGTGLARWPCPTRLLLLFGSVGHSPELPVDAGEQT